MSPTQLHWPHQPPKKEKDIKSQVLRMHRHTGGNIYPYLYLATQIPLSSFVRSHTVPWEAGRGCPLRIVTVADVC